MTLTLAEIEQVIEKEKADINIIGRAVASHLLDALREYAQTRDSQFPHVLDTIQSDKWIRVEDRLPEFNQRVLILTDRGVVFTAQFRDNFMRDTLDAIPEDRIMKFSWSNIELWQPLPEKPSLKTEKSKY